MSFTDCSGVISVLAQRRQIALFNVPLVRLTLSSPYPQFTKMQLDMRRKVEILKYNNTASTTKTNNLTKKQQWSLLVKGNTQNYSQNAIIASPTIATCPLDALLPTLTSSCDVPGTPIILQYDPSVPLYNYIVNNRTYPDQNIVSTITYNQYSTNFLEFLQTNTINLPQDVISNVVYIPQIRTFPTGVIIFNANAISTSKYTTFSITTPLALWTNFIYGLGTTDIDGNVIKQPGLLASTDLVSISVTNISLIVSYNGSVINLSSVPILSYSGLNSVTFLGRNVPIGQNYGIQYIGMLNVTNLQLPFATSTVYDIIIKVTYNVSINGSLISTPNQFDAFQTGIFTNITLENSYITTPGFMFSSIAPPYQNGTFNTFITSTSNIIG